MKPVTRIVFLFVLSVAASCSEPGAVETHQGDNEDNVDLVEVGQVENCTQILITDTNRPIGEPGFVVDAIGLRGPYDNSTDIAYVKRVIAYEDNGVGIGEPEGVVGRYQSTDPNCYDLTVYDGINLGGGWILVEMDRQIVVEDTLIVWYCSHMNTRSQIEVSFPECDVDLSGMQTDPGSSMIVFVD